MTESRPNSGWASDFPSFRSAPPAVIRERLSAFISDASPEQVRAWADAIPPLQREVDEVLIRDLFAAQYSAILEYELPMESRRPDVILLVGTGVLVVELKGKLYPSQADLDQVAAYARDLRNYHRECADRLVVPVLVPTRARGYQQEIAGIHVTGPDGLDGLVSRIALQSNGPVVDRERFLAQTAYCPLPSLVEAARELFKTGDLRTIKRAHSATQPAVEEITRIVHQAALTKSRHMILLSGSPGAGKTLVGLRTVHAHYLDDLAVDRGNGKPPAPAVFLSGNEPLVQVLQYELNRAGPGEVDGKVFVRNVRDYVKHYSGARGGTPNEHVMVFDEAQRAYDVAKMRDMQKSDAAKSEPEHFVEFAERVPEWCVVLCLIGGGQEIHVGEEAGVGQWKRAIEGSQRSSEWTIHAPPNLESEVSGGNIPFEIRSPLNLDKELRFHTVNDLHRYVASLLSNEAAASIRDVADQLASDTFHLRLTRDLEVAKQYLRDRYSDARERRFGMLASSRDKDLPAFGVHNHYMARRLIKVGPWFADDADDPKRLSCRHLETCVTEFEAQGLELDAVLLAWGTDFRRDGGRWSISRSAGYRGKVPARNPEQLRVNAYRVLLTRGRDAIVVFVPPLAELDETFVFLREAGFQELETPSSARSDASHSSNSSRS